MNRTSTAGLIEIASHEGIVTAPYYDSVSVLTIFIGHTAAAGSPNPGSYPKGVQRPVQEAIEVFRRDIAKYEDRVRRAFTRPLTQTQFDAAVSFDFNTGGIHKASWVDKFNAGDMAGAKKAFMNWSKPKDIIPRRTKERDLFFNGRYSSGGYVNAYPANSKGRVQWSQGKRVNIASLLQDAQKPIPAPTPRPTPKPAPQGKSGGNNAVALIIGAAVAAIGAAWAAFGEFIHELMKGF